MSLESCIKAITAQQGTKHDAVWMCGEHLKDILRNEPKWADMVERDLANPKQSLKAVEAEIAKKAKANKVGNVGVVTPMEAEEIIRRMYGLTKEPPRAKKEVNVNDFF